MLTIVFMIIGAAIAVGSLVWTISIRIAEETWKRAPISRKSTAKNTGAHVFKEPLRYTIFAVIATLGIGAFLGLFSVKTGIKKGTEAGRIQREYELGVRYLEYAYRTAESRFRQTIMRIETEFNWPPRRHEDRSEAQALVDCHDAIGRHNIHIQADFMSIQGLVNSGRDVFAESDLGIAQFLETLELSGGKEKELLAEKFLELPSGQKELGLLKVEVLNLLKETAKSLRENRAKLLETTKNP